jgi:ribonuclease P protein component
MRACFPADARVRQGRDFRAAFGEGQRHKARYFSLHLRFRGGGFCRLGLAVSRKVSPLAVERNRIKRQCRESFRLARAAGLPDADYILVARLDAARQSSAVLRADLDALWRRCAALKPPAPAGTMPAPAAGLPDAPAAPTSPFPSTDAPSRPDGAEPA